MSIRPNVLSDLHPSIFEPIIKAHPDVSFYDYTKMDTKPVAPNHHLTYSSTGVSQPAGINGNDTDVFNKFQNWSRMQRVLDRGDNIAMVFTHGDHLPETVFDSGTGKTYNVVDGTTHDYRPMDKVAQPDDPGAPRNQGVIVGLKNMKSFGEKQSAHVDTKGFMVYYDPQERRNADGSLYRVPGNYGIDKKGNPKSGPTVPTNKQVIIAPQERNTKAYRDNDGKPEPTQ